MSFRSLVFALVELGIPTLVSNMIDEGVMRNDRTYLLQSGALIALISVIGGFGNDPAGLLLCQDLDSRYQRHPQ